MKKISSTIINEKYFFLLLSLYFITGLIIFSDYGISWDEVNERYSGFVSLNEIYKKLNLNILQNYPDLSNYIYREYGVLFNLPLAFLEDFAGIKDIKDVFLLRHLINFLIFFLGSAYFYFTLRIYYSQTISIIGFLFLILSPRIFAEAFYNNKDIIFLSFYSISFYYFLQYFIDKKNSFIFFFSLFASMAINVRVLGILIVFIFIFVLFLDGLNSQKIFKKNSLEIIKCLLFVSILSYLLWPFLWSNPLENLIYTFKSMSSYNWRGLVFFLGEYHQARNIPWNYSITLFLVTTPLIIIIFFLIGASFSIKDLTLNYLNIDNKEYSNLWTNNFQFFNIIALLNIIIILSYVILFDSTLYGGWRHTYFLYPFIIILSIYGINILIKHIKYNFILIISFFSILSSLYWIMNNHPYQFVYYNLLTKNKIKANFELDYWGVSNKDSLEYLLDNYKKNKYFVYVYSNSPYYYSKNLIDKDKREKIIFVKKIEDAEFILTNHFYLNQSPIKKDKYLYDNFKLINEIIVNNNAINSIFKKKL